MVHEYKWLWLINSLFTISRIDDKIKIWPTHLIDMNKIRQEFKY